MRGFGLPGEFLCSNLLLNLQAEVGRVSIDSQLESDGLQDDSNTWQHQTLLLVGDVTD